MNDSSYITSYISEEKNFYLLLFTICIIFFLLPINNRQRNLNDVIPNIISMFIIGPIFLTIGAFNTQYKSLYLFIFLISLGLLLNVIYELIKEKKPLTFGRLFYLLIGIPLLMYISIMQEKSSLYARRILFILGLVYMIYNIDVVCFNVIPKYEIIKGVPSHPIRRLI